MNPDIKLAYESIVNKRDALTDAFAYYDGDHPIIYSTARLASIFKSNEVKFIQNWCAVVIDSLKERIQLKGFTVPDQVKAEVDRLWIENQLSLESDDLHEAVHITGEGFIIVQESETGGSPEIFYNDPRLVTAIYYEGNPRNMRLAAKMWIDELEHYRLTLYYPDRFEYYISQGKAENVTNAGAFTPDPDQPEAPNPWGKIPVFHFRLSKRVIKGDLHDVIPLQNAVNKLLTDMMVVGDYGAFKQRYIITNSDVSGLRNSPDAIWEIPAGDGSTEGTKVGEFSATDLKNYLEAISQIAGDIAKISRTPKHYIFGQAGDPSGEALTAMEAPLIRKAQDHIERFDPVWSEVIAYALQLKGYTINHAEINPEWETVETVQPKTRADIRLLTVNSGIPLITALKREGWTETEIEDMIKDQTLTTDMLADSLLNQFDKGQGLQHEPR